MCKIFFASLVLAATVAAHADIDLKGFDSSIKPQDDFFRYVNGTWLKTVVIPPDMARYASFNRLQEDNWDRLHAICERAAQKPAATGAEKWVGDFYATGMDEAGIDRAGVAPLQPELERIAAVRTPADVMAALGHLRRYGLRAGFTFSSSPDAKDSN